MLGGDVLTVRTMVEIYALQLGFIGRHTEQYQR